MSGDGEDPRFTDWLHECAGEDWPAATEHRFTPELGRGDLDDAVFRRYLVQDYAFVGDLVGVFGHAVGEAPTMAAKSRLVDFLGVLTAEENDYFERSFEALGVPEETYADTERFYLAEWVDLHANPDFESFVGWLCRELDREGAAASPRRQRRIGALFRRTVELEVAFLEAAYHPDAGAVTPHPDAGPTTPGTPTDPAGEVSD